MGLITDAIRIQASNAIDSLQASSENGGLGKDCLLIFDPKRVRCSNCVYDSLNKCSANRYLPGGPQPFPLNSLCPICNGKGTLDTPVTKPIVLLLNWAPKTWLAMPNMDMANVNIEVPGGACQAKGFMTDLPNVLQSRKMVIETAITGIKQYIYVLAGEPIDPSNIVQGRYFMSIWKRAPQ